MLPKLNIPTNQIGMVATELARELEKYRESHSRYPELYVPIVSTPGLALGICDCGICGQWRLFHVPTDSEFLPESVYDQIPLDLTTDFDSMLRLAYWLSQLDLINNVRMSYDGWLEYHVDIVDRVTAVCRGFVSGDDRMVWKALRG